MLVKAVGRRDTESPDDVTDFVTLMGELKSIDPSTRRQAVRALRDTPSAISVLLCHLETEQNAIVRSVVLTSLIRMRSADMAEKLANLLRSEDVALRNDVIEALQAMPDEAIPCLDRLLGDPDSDIRIFAVNIITGLGHPAVRSLLKRVLLEETHINVCLAVIDGLEEIGDDSFILPLTAFGERFASIPLAQYAVTASIRRIRGSK